MKIWTILIILIMASGFVMAAKPIISISITPTNGEAGSEYSVKIANNAQITIQKITFFFGPNETVPSSSSSCPYTSSGIYLRSQEQAFCTFKVPQLAPGAYSVGVRYGQSAIQATELFRVINSSSKYQELLSKIKVGEKIPDEYGAVISDGAYQGYVVGSTPLNDCDGTQLRSGQINYDAVVTIESGKIKSVTRGKTQNSIMEICLSDKAIRDIENSTDPKTTVLEELESGDMSYKVNDTVQQLKFAFLKMAAGFLGGDYVKIGKILSFAK